MLSLMIHAGYEFSNYGRTRCNVGYVATLYIPNESPTKTFYFLHVLTLNLRTGVLLLNGDFFYNNHRHRYKKS